MSINAEWWQLLLHNVWKLVVRLLHKRLEQEKYVG